MFWNLCSQDHTCGARVPLHVEGADDLVVGQGKEAFQCGSFNVLDAIDCCVLRLNITVKRCNQDLYVYKLPVQERCPVAFCAQSKQPLPSPKCFRLTKFVKSRVPGNCYRLVFPLGLMCFNNYCADSDKT